MIEVVYQNIGRITRLEGLGIFRQDFI